MSSVALVRESVQRGSGSVLYSVMHQESNFSRRDSLDIFGGSARGAAEVMILLCQFEAARIKKLCMLPEAEKHKRDCLW